MSQLTKEELSKGVIASSAGNHAQGVALSASFLTVGSDCNASYNSIMKVRASNHTKQKLFFLVKLMMSVTKKH